MQFGCCFSESPLIGSAYKTLNDTRDRDAAIPNIFKWGHAKFQAWVADRAKPQAPQAPPSADDDAYVRRLEQSSRRHEKKLTSQE